MISWIQHHLIRHGRWVFLSLLAVIIIAFVFTIGNTPGCTTDRSNYQPNLFYGIDLNAPRDRDPLIERVRLSAFLNNQQVQSDQQFQGLLTSRIAMLHLADEIGIPAPDQGALAEFIRSKRVFQGPDGNFSADAYTSFVDQFENNPRAPQGMVIRVLEEDYRIERVMDALAGPGYLLPSEAQSQAQRSRTKLTLATAELAYASFEPEIQPDEATLKEFFEANKESYEIPERVQASYVLFENDRFLDEVPEASEGDLRQHFEADRARFVAEYEASRNESDGESEAEVTFEQVRDLVAASLAEQKAAELAHEAATEFAIQLYNDDIERESAAFNQLLNQLELELIKIEPYTEAGARQRALSPALLQSAFTLTGRRYYSDAHQLDDGFAVLIYQGRIDPFIPPFEEVADQVIADYTREERRRLFNEKGESLKAELEAALAGGTAFAEAAESLELRVNNFDPFEVRNAPSQLSRSALQRAQSLGIGELSPMLTLSETGTFVYVENKEVPELDEEDPELAQTLNMLGRWSSFTTQNDLTNELVLRGLPGERARAIE